MAGIEQLRDRREMEDDHSTGSVLNDQGAVSLYLSRVGRAVVGIAAGLIYSPDEIK